jgi:hypothetical protein
MRNTHGTVRHAGRKLVAHTLLSMLVAALGVALLLYMILVEDEPGAVPPALIALGIGWFIVARVRLRPQAGRNAASR